MVQCPNILLVGAGKWGRNHLRVLKELEGQGLCKLVGVVDSNPESLHDISTPTSTKMDDFIEEANAVDIVTPASTHYSTCMRLLNQGKDIFIEKPLAVNYKEAYEMMTFAERKNLILMPGHIHRYNQVVNWLKDYMNDSKFGEILYVGGRYLHFGDRRQDVGAILDLAIHHIDICNYLFEDIPDTVTCIASYPLNHLDSEDYCLISLDYQKISATIEAGWIYPSKIRSLEIAGTNSSIILDLLEQKIQLYKTELRSGGNAAVKAEPSKTIRPNFVEPLKEELKDFVNSISSRKHPRVTAADGVNALAVAQAAFKSVQEKRTVGVMDHAETKTR